MTASRAAAGRLPIGFSTLGSPKWTWIQTLDFAAAPERIFVVNVLSFDWNCPKFITPRYTLEEVEVATSPLHRRIAELEAQLADAATRK